VAGVVPRGAGSFIKWIGGGRSSAATCSEDRAEEKKLDVVDGSVDIVDLTAVVKACPMRVLPWRPNWRCNSRCDKLPVDVQAQLTGGRVVDADKVIQVLATGAVGAETKVAFATRIGCQACECKRAGVAAQL